MFTVVVIKSSSYSVVVLLLGVAAVILLYWQVAYGKNQGDYSTIILLIIHDFGCSFTGAPLLK